MGKPAKFNRPITVAEIRIALRWFRAQIGTAEAGKLLGEINPDGSSLVYRLSIAVRQGIALGLLQIQEMREL